MNHIDVISIALLLFATWRGWRSGIIMQLSAIVGIVVGAWVASNFSHIIAGWLSLDADNEAVAYIVALVVVMVAVIIILWMVNKLLTIGGLSVPIKILGAVASIAKMVLIMTLLQSLYLSVSDNFKMAHKGTMLKESYTYPILKEVGAVAFPYIKEAAAKLYTPKMEQKVDSLANEALQVVDSLKISKENEIKDSVSKSVKNN